eukprot:11421321-Ditylum_brightwellii.AAC.1
MKTVRPCTLAVLIGDNTLKEREREKENSPHSRQRCACNTQLLLINKILKALVQLVTWLCSLAQLP